MAQSIDLLNTPVRKIFFQYMIPAVIGMSVKSIFLITDTIFIGRSLGSIGLSIVSFAAPFFMISMALHLMVGIGGGVMMSVQFGKNNHHTGQKIFVQSMATILVITALMVATSLLWIDEIIHFMGATGETAQLAKQYLYIILPFFLIFDSSLVLSCFVRNDTNPSLAMTALISGAISNIILDYLFIIEFEWGVQGAAYAAGSAQVLMLAILMGHFIQQKGYLKLNCEGLGFDQIKGVFTIGFPVFIIEAASTVAMIFVNHTLATEYSELHIAAYRVAINAGLLAVFPILGICEACQPLLSFNYGAGRLDRVREILTFGLRYSVTLGACAAILTLTCSGWLASLYTESDHSLTELAANALQVYSLALPLMAFNMMVVTLLQSIESPDLATALSLGRVLVFILIGALLLPTFFGQNGIWGCVLFAETTTLIFCAAVLYRLFYKSPQPRTKVRAIESI